MKTKPLKIIAFLDQRLFEYNALQGEIQRYRKLGKIEQFFKSVFDKINYSNEFSPKYCEKITRLLKVNS